jgi:hypothetical protein
MECLSTKHRFVQLYNCTMLMVNSLVVVTFTGFRELTLANLKSSFTFVHYFVRTLIFRGELSIKDINFFDLMLKNILKMFLIG